MTSKSHRSTAQRLKERAEKSRMIRSFFDERGFIEVHSPCLIDQCIADRFIEPVCVTGNQLGLASERQDQDFFLQTSPELALKQLLADGSGSVYSLGPVFRAGEMGDCHHIEFTMLEWYEVGANLADGINTLGQLAVELLPVDQFDVVTYRELFRQTLSIDPIASGLSEVQALIGKIDPHLLGTLGDDRDGLLDCLLSIVIQPGLAPKCPLIVTHYPVSQAALAKTSDDDPDTAARFELFFRGVELANGYDELLDPDQLVIRLEHVNRSRQADGKQPIKPPRRLVQAMQKGLPQSAGVAMGFDRLLMVCGGSGENGFRKIDEVLTLPKTT